MDQQEPVVSDQPPASSFMTRAANVFASPNELYGEVALAPPRKSSWLIPFLLSVIVAVLVTFSLYNNPTLRQQIYDMQLQGMRKSVESGQMTQDQYDQISGRMESSGPVMFMAVGAGFAILVIAVMYFGGALILWGTARIGLKFGGSYSKLLETFGLASLIGVLGSIVTVLMMNLLDSVTAGPAASLIILRSFDPTNIAHRLLATLNLFSLWEAGVLGIGLAKLSGRSIAAGMAYSYGLWAVWSIVASLLGFGIH